MLMNNNKEQYVFLSFCNKKLKSLLMEPLHVQWFQLFDGLQWEQSLAQHCFGNHIFDLLFQLCFHVNTRVMLKLAKVL